jgi:hypothetical protein
VEALGMGGLGGPDGTVSDRISVLRYSEGCILWPVGCQEQKREAWKPGSAEQ